MKPAQLRADQWRKYNLFFILQHFLGYERYLKYCGEAKDRFERELLAQLGERCAFPLGEVPHLDRGTARSEFERFDGQPLVFRGAASDWICTRQWSFDFFRERYGSTEVILNDNVGMIDDDQPQRFGKMKLADYIDAIRGGARMYLKFARDIFEDNPQLKDDLDLGWLRGMRPHNAFRREEILMFMSLAGTLTPMHSGVSGNLFIQVVGQKTWTMFQPGDQVFLDGRTERTFYYFSKVDPRRLDDSRFPLAKFATKYEVTLEPGDVLWVPPFYWHHVYNPTDSIGVTYRVMSLPASFRASLLLMTLIFFATRPNPFYHFYLSTIRKKTAIFQEKFSDL